MTTYRKRYFKKRGRKPTIARPYGSVYDTDYYMKVNGTQPIVIAAGAAFIQMRTDVALSAANVQALLDIPEFANIKNSFATYSVVGMKMEAIVQQFTAGPGLAIRGISLYAGQGNNVSSAAATPTPTNRLVSLPFHKMAGPGTKVSVYYAYEKDLKKQGIQTAIATSSTSSNSYGGLIYCDVGFQGFANGDTVGEVHFTYYVRLSGRRSL